MVTRMFKDQLGKTMEAYIDDMVVKSKFATDYLTDLREFFGILKNHQLRLNALKCAFGVGTGKFLGYMLLKKRAAFEWSSECTEALQSLKKYLSTPPLLSTPEPGEELYLYLAVSDHAVSAVLIREVNKEQRPVYYVSKTLLDAMTRRADFSGRTAKWGVELGEFDIRYQPRTGIKAQVLADFVVEFAPTQSIEQGKPCVSEAWKLFIGNIWQLYVDGSPNNRGLGAGVVLISPEGFIWEQALRLGWKASNNEAEYEALLAGLRSAEHFSAEQLLVFRDSQLVVNQLSRVYETQNERMAMYAGKGKDLLKKFQSIQVERISQDKNGHADTLACLGSSVDTKDARKVWVEFMPEPSIASPVLCSSIEPSWMDPLLAFLKSGTLPRRQKGSQQSQTQVSSVLDLTIREAVQTLISWPFIFYVCIQIWSRMFSTKFAMGFVDATLAEGHWRTEPSLTGIGGHGCNKMLSNTYRSVINVRVEALANIKEADTKRFVMRNVVVRFGIPRVLIANNGTQFDGIKAQVLADFVVEFAPTQSIEQGKPCVSEAWKLFIGNIWQLYVDGSPNNRGLGAGVVLISPEGFIWEQALRLGWKASNNEAEYEATNIS
ncbi:uncharacterized protein LOC114308761 [Camellia sinensis]|uniref:uncharacterized protein LOC114308761 n=1 Tax=Camellia sinensis TaxID=4442 RepID=UPI001036DB85|nr:uncharacterized protein LOC114308761 [Camellia sinensis]